MPAHREFQEGFPGGSPLAYGKTVGEVVRWYPFFGQLIGRFKVYSLPLKNRRLARV